MLFGELKPGMLFQSPMKGQERAEWRVENVQPSRMDPDATRMEVRAKRGASGKIKVIVLPNDTPVNWLKGKAARPPNPPKQKKVPPPPKPRCQCRNHLGKPKYGFRTHKAAERYILRKYKKWTGAMGIYPCPRIPDLFHVTTAPRV